MREIAFSIPVSGTIRIEDDSIRIMVNRSETTVDLAAAIQASRRPDFGPGKTMFDVLLEVALEVAAEQGSFTAADLYHRALEMYPDLKRGSWSARVIASAPNHPSYSNYGARRDYLVYTGRGRYRLKPEHSGGSDSGTVFDTRGR
jgi:hypothetical protein